MSPAQLEANRCNTRKSTGTGTSAGKEIPEINAITK
jgi:hypothetical protein